MGAGGSYSAGHHLSAAAVGVLLHLLSAAAGQVDINRPSVDRILQSCCCRSKFLVTRYPVSGLEVHLGKVPGQGSPVPA